MKTLVTIICLFVPFPKPRRRLRQWLKERLCSTPSDTLHLRRFLRNQPVVLWVDHALGGGTETYSLRQFDVLKKKHTVVRMQYFHWNKMFCLSIPNRRRMPKCQIASLDEISDILQKSPIHEIVVNNLVGYKNSLAILDFVARLKTTHKCRVSFRGHDFQAICPSFNLLNCDGNFCNFKYKGGCEACWKKKKLDDCDATDRILRSGATSVAKWRDAWGKFFAHTADEVIVFSDAVRDLFVRIYPQLADKTLVIPHFIPSLRQANVIPHTGINIACLGNMQLQLKGRDIILRMGEIIKGDPNIRITVIGNMDAIDNISKNITVTGKYNLKNLPAIMEKHKIDLVFISSICPETFSYTTAEAMSMGLPVACYNMGAPAERVGQYEKGLVLSEINPKKNLQEIIEFIKKKKE